MFIMVDTNEATDREKNRKDRKSRPDGSNIRVVKRLQKRFPELQQTTLDCGDIKIILDNGQTIAIERKRAGDFIGSIGDGHIFRQVHRMNEGADWSVIIVEGLIGFNSDDMATIPMFDKEDNIVGTEVTGWHGGSVRGAMYAIEFNATPIITIMPKQLPDVIEDIIRFCQKPLEHTQMLARRRIVTFPPVTIAEEVVAAFPGVGLKRTRSLREFAKENNDTDTPTLAEMLCWGSFLAKAAYRSRPEGWGDIVVKNFRGTLGLQDGEYLTIVTDKEELQAKRKVRTNGNSKK